MGRAVDSSRKPAHDRDASRGQIAGQALGEGETVSGGPSRAHDGDGQRVLRLHGARAPRAARAASA